MATAIFDGHYLLHRVLHVPSMRMLCTKDGKPTGGVFGTIKSIRSTVGTWGEITKVIVVFDGGRSRRRKQIYPQYKANRRPDHRRDIDGLTYSQKFASSHRYLRFLLPRFGVKVVQLDGREGDDVVGLLARSIPGHLKLVVSDDKDMLQLVSGDVHVWRPIAQERVTLDNFEELVHCKKEHWMLRKAVLGDGSDNIKGIEGVGQKTVDDLIDIAEDIGEYPHDSFFEASMVDHRKRYMAVAKNIGVVLRNFELIDLTREHFTPEEIERSLALASAPNNFDILAVRRMFDHFEFNSLVEDFHRWITRFQMLR